MYPYGLYESVVNAYEDPPPPPTDVYRAVILAAA